MSFAIPLPINIGSIAASQLIGSLLNFSLYGVLAVQVYAYRLMFPHDKRSIKWLIYSVFSLQTALTAVNGADVYYWFAAGFGDVLEFSQPRFSPFYTPVAGSAMALIVQTFFCYRIYIIERRLLWLCIVIILTSLAGGIGGAISTYLSLNQENTRIIFAYIWLVCDAIADLLISGVMLVLFTKARLHQRQKENTDISKRIVRMVIETNTLAMAVSVLSLILFCGTPNTTYFICPTMVLATLYSNTLFVTFNNRTFSRNSRKWDISNSDVYISTSQSKDSKTLPFSAGLRLDTATEVLTVTYHGNPSRTGFSIDSTTEESYTFDGDRVNLQMSKNTKMSV
ncbi:hypothetical protein DFH08DRAFT_952863 [Mycena albidolilacea]|uniref:DUF6534 domain-containing protein n=1 Tax=Mycena albidolilacea TaxID=1033008 RepID=A0AAD7F125_9AGAR|nr:hypothetical protein DFH08DRAFT_952863 [Mycena albidolilacea]